MRSRDRVKLVYVTVPIRFAKFLCICLLGVRELVDGRPLTCIRSSGGILRDIHTQFFFDVPRLANAEIQINGHLLRLVREALRLSILPAMMKVPP